MSYNKIRYKSYRIRREKLGYSVNEKRGLVVLAITQSLLNIEHRGEDILA